MLSSTHRRTLAAAAVAALLAPATAAADSIVHIDGGNVWSARPDGSGRVQLTTGGGWHSPTQADDGTIAAVQGTGPIRIMARDGRPLRTITTQGARSADGGSFAPRPVDLSLTPDGSRLAYSYVADSCPVASTCGTTQRSTFYTDTNVDQATPQASWGNQFGVSDPEWITNDRALVSGGSGSQLAIDPLGGGDSSFTQWMTPNGDMGDPELSRDMSRLATTFFYGKDKIIAFFAVKGDPRSELPPAQPDAACNTDPDEQVSDPSWSPDSSSVAYRSVSGIEVQRFTALSAAGCATVDKGTVLTPTGTEPDWGPADPPAARWAVPAPTTPGPLGGGAAGPGTGAGGGSTPGGKARVALTGAAKRALRGGRLVLRCTAPGARRCTATVTIKRRGRSFTAKAAGKPGAALTVRFSPATRRALTRALRSGTLRATVRLVASGGPGGSVTASRRLTLTR